MLVEVAEEFDVVDVTVKLDVVDVVEIGGVDVVDGGVEDVDEF